MALKVAHKIKRTPIEVKPDKSAEKAEKRRKLPPDEYRDELTPVEVVLDEGNKLIVSVKRDAEEGLPRVDVRHYVTSERYTGFTKKGINFSLANLLELLDTLRNVADQCEEKGLFEEFED